MGTTCFAVLASVVIVFQAPCVVSAEEAACEPGFQSDMLVFEVNRKDLKPGMRLGKVDFTDCTDRTRFPFSSEDDGFMVQTDGILMVKTQVVLHEGHKDFFIHSWDSHGQKMTVPVRVVHKHHGNQIVEQQTHNHQHQLAEVDMAANTEVPILHFPKSSGGLRRRKREWVIPDLSVVENDRGPYPLKVSQIRSNEDKVKKIYYSITGPGADQPPVGLFTMDRDTGVLYLTQPLDRETQSKYTFIAHAVSEGAEKAEDPMDIVVNVIDQNDNKPVFSQATYMGEVPEASSIGFEVIQVQATDIDEPNNDNSDVRYSIIGQDPELPSKGIFDINPVNGMIRVKAGGLDRENYPLYTLVVQAADMRGDGLTGQAKVILTVTDSNDNAPVFTQSSYEVTVPENAVDALVVKMSVTDGDEPHSPAWNAKFKIINGDPGGLFTVTTAPTNKQEGIITTAKGLDFEKSTTHTLLVTVENEVPFAIPMPTSTATVLVTVQDLDDPPIFNPSEMVVFLREDLAVDSVITHYTASHRGKIMYKVISDPAGWLNVTKGNGLITVKTPMDRESPFVKDNMYTALIGAYDDDEVRATGTGTLIIQLEDVNDNPPFIEERVIKVCNKQSPPKYLSVKDKDGPGFTSPYSVTIQGMFATCFKRQTPWTATMDNTRTGVILTLTSEVAKGKYVLILRVTDNQGLGEDSAIMATVCDCTGEQVAETTCP